MLNLFYIIFQFKNNLNFAEYFGGRGFFTFVFVKLPIIF